MNLRSILMAVLVLAFVLVQVGSATEYYVSASGDNGNDGLSSGQAWGTVDYALSQLSAGDTLYFTGGTFNTRGHGISTDGTAENHIVIDTLDGSGFADDASASYGSGVSVLSISGDYIDIYNLSINRYNCTGFSVSGEHHILNNVTSKDICAKDGALYGLDGSYGSAIVIRSNDVLISNSEFNSTRWNTVQISTTDNSTSYDTEHVTLENCDIGYGVDHGTLDFFNANYNQTKYIKNILVSNCTIHDSPYGLMYPHGAEPSRMENITIINNEFYEGSYGPQLGYLFNSTISNNYVHDCSSYGIGSITDTKPGGGTVIENNTVVGGTRPIELYLRRGYEMDIKENNATYMMLSSGNASINDLNDWTSELCTYNLIDNLDFTLQIYNHLYANLSSPTGRIISATTSSDAYRYDCDESVTYSNSGSSFSIQSTSSEIATFNIDYSDLGLLPYAASGDSIMSAVLDSETDSLITFTLSDFSNVDSVNVSVHGVENNNLTLKYGNGTIIDSIVESSNNIAWFNDSITEEGSYIIALNEYVYVPSMYNFSDSNITDAYVRGGAYANTNYEGENYIYAKDTSDDYYSRKSVLNITIPSNLTEASHATLYLFSRTDCSAGEMDIYSSYDSVDTSTVTWNTLPAIHSLITTAPAYDEQWLAIDITDHINNNIENGSAVIVLKDSDDDDLQFTFNATEAAANTPYVLYEYEQFTAFNPFPSTDPTTTTGESQTFSINLSDTATVVWMKDGVPIETDTDVTYAEVTIEGEEAGTYNVAAVADDGSTEVSRTWTWTVTDTTTFSNPVFVGGGFAGVVFIVVSFFNRRRR